jgi:hypothetical protein
MIKRDFDGVERAIELMVASGHDGPALDRLRAMSALSRGDRDAARQALRHPLAEQDDRGSTRDLLTRALVMLETGELERGTRVALRALSKTRGAGDVAGERAALQTLSLYYRRLGRNDDARGLEVAAASVGTLPRATVSGS